MAKMTATERAIDGLQGEIKVLELAISKLQAQLVTKPRKERKNKKGTAAQEAMDRL